MHLSSLLRCACKSLSPLILLLAMYPLLCGGLLHAQSVGTNPASLRSASALPNWQYGLYASGGFPPDYKTNSGNCITASGQKSPLIASEKLEFWNAGFLGGRMLSALHGPGILRGRVESMVEVMPFWMARYPHQSVTTTGCGFTGTDPGFGPINMYGASATPFLFRWNFQRHPDSRNLAWIQFGGGLLWTNHKFPYRGDSSVINFTPQADLGYSRFLRHRQSLDLALKVVHISSAGLGDNNPGVNYSLQFSAGYSWWK